MKIFVTGGTGYLGSVLVEYFVKAGHEVTALARSEASVRSLATAGAIPIPGTLSDVEVLESAAAQADATVHAAMDYTQTEEATATELAAVAALVRGAGSADSAKPVVYTSTGLVYGFDPAQNRREDAELPAVSAQPVKAAAEQIVTQNPSISGIVIRAGLIYGRGGTGLLTGLIQGATASGRAIYVGEGTNSWTPVHVDDLADLYLKAIERPTAGIYNAVGNHTFTFRELAEAIGSLTGTSAVSLPPADAQTMLGPLAQIIATSGELSAAKAAATFGWSPTGPALLDDVRAGSYTAGSAPGAGQH